MFGFGSPALSPDLAEMYKNIKSDTFHMEIFNTKKDTTPSFGKIVVGNTYTIKI